MHHPSSLLVRLCLALQLQVMFRALGECDDGGGGGISLMINPQFALCEASVKLRLHTCFHIRFHQH